MTTPITAGHPVHFLDENARPYGIKQIDGKPRVSAMPYTYDIAEGKVPGHTGLIIFGSNPDVGTSQETVWDEGGIYAYLTEATVLKVSSGDANDDVGDAGATSVRIYGLDANYTEINETIAMNGQTAVNERNLRNFHYGKRIV